MLAKRYTAEPICVKLQLANLFVKEWGREYTTLLLKAVTVKPISENKQKGGKTLTNL